MKCFDFGRYYSGGEENERKKDKKTKRQRQGYTYKAGRLLLLGRLVLSLALSFALLLAGTSASARSRRHAAKLAGPLRPTRRVIGGRGALVDALRGGEFAQMRIGRQQEERFLGLFEARGGTGRGAGRGASQRAGAGCAAGGSAGTAGRLAGRHLYARLVDEVM